MSGLALIAHQFRFDQKVFWRNPAAVFFTVMLPLIFLIIFSTIFGNEPIEELGIDTTTYYVPAIITLAVISATLVNLAIRLTEERESGILKRAKGTPLPQWAFIGGRVGNSLVISVVMLTVVAVLGRAIYDVEIPFERLPAILITLAIGAAAFSCIGVALTGLIPSEDAAPAITNAVVLPLYFLSGVFIPDTEIPDGVLSFADAFPIRHFFQAFLEGWTGSGSGFALDHLAVVVGWGLVGLFFAVRYFRWTPQAD